MNGKQYKELMALIRANEVQIHELKSQIRWMTGLAIGVISSVEILTRFLM
ncbi:MAG: hypothetical protein R3321_09395 [Nitrososphaeraceae archaeon]|nr:hypothetical protein [Nitrososphaeraceae archaeon]